MSSQSSNSVPEEEQTQTTATSTSTTQTTTTTTNFEVVVDDTTPENGEIDINYTGTIELTKVTTKEESYFETIKTGLETLQSNLDKSKGMGTLDDMQEMICSMRRLQVELKEKQDLTQQLKDIKDIKEVLVGYRNFFISIKEEFSDVWTIDIEEIIKEFASVLLEVAEVSEELVNFRNIFNGVLTIKQSESIFRFKSYVSETTTHITKLVDVMAHFAGEDTQTDMSEYDITEDGIRRNQTTKDTINAFYNLAKNNMNNSDFSKQTTAITEEISHLKDEKKRFADILKKLEDKTKNMTCAVGGDIDQQVTLGAPNGTGTTPS